MTLHVVLVECLLNQENMLKEMEGILEILVLEGQESNYGNLAMCKMNHGLHNIIDFKIEYGDILTIPN